MRCRFLDPILYRFGYTHHETQISGVTSWLDGEVVGGRVEGLLEFPGFDVDVAYVEFQGVVVDPPTISGEKQ